MVLQFSIPSSHYRIRSCFEGSQLIRGPWAWLEPTGGCVDLVKVLDVTLKQEDPLYLRFEWGSLAGFLESVLQDRNTFDCQRKTEGRPASLCEPPQCGVCGCPDHLCGLAQIEVTVSIFIDVRLGFSHPETTANPHPEIQPEITFAPDYVPHPNSGPDGFFD